MKRERSREYKDRQNKKKAERYANDHIFRKACNEQSKKWYYETRCLQGRFHGLQETRAWKAWHSMRCRVLCPTNKHYNLYKDRTIDPRWDSFVNFYEDMGECPVGLTLDRKDNNSGYRKDNCRWATRKQQSHNTRVTKLSEDKVQEMRGLFGSVSITALAKKYGVAACTISNVKAGRIWVEEASHV
jgi:hypothetical protein